VTEYWLTALVFEVGDKFIHGGQWRVVTSIATPDGYTTRTADGDGRHATIIARPDEDAVHIHPPGRPANAG
jgi:hypothetical protein